MDDKLELFRAALGLPEPWRVVETRFDPAARRLDLWLDFAPGTRLPCPEGDERACPVHDTTPKTWRHLDFFQHQAYLHARTPRVCCPTHGVRQVAVPWARPASGFTLLFEALVMELVAEMPVKAVAELVGCDDARLWRVLHHYVGAARAAMDMSAVTDVGVDETSAARGHDYISLFVDLNRDKGPRVLFATPGRDAATVKRFAADLTAHGGDPDAVVDVACDMSPAFIAGVGEHLKQAQITFDRFHTIQLLTKALDEVRRAEAKVAPTLLKGTRYLWLKRPEHLTKRQKAELQFLTVKHKALATARAYRCRGTRPIRPGTLKHPSQSSSISSDADSICGLTITYRGDRAIGEDSRLPHLDHGCGCRPADLRCGQPGALQLPEQGHHPVQPVAYGSNVVDHLHRYPKRWVAHCHDAGMGAARLPGRVAVCLGHFCVLRGVFTAI